MAQDYFSLSIYRIRRKTVQKLADIIVEKTLPFAACPGHTLLPALRTLSSSFYVLQAVPHSPKNLQGLKVSMANGTLHKPCISAENSKGIRNIKT